MTDLPRQRTQRARVNRSWWLLNAALTLAILLFAARGLIMDALGALS